MPLMSKKVQFLLIKLKLRKHYKNTIKRIQVLKMSTTKNEKMLTIKILLLTNNMKF